MTNGMGSALLVPALGFPALPDEAAPAPASQQDARVPLPASGDDCHVSMDLTAELAGIIDVSEEEAWLRAQAWQFEQTFEARAEQHFGSRLVEYERNMAERTKRNPVSKDVAASTPVLAGSCSKKSQRHNPAASSSFKVSLSNSSPVIPTTRRSRHSVARSRGCSSPPASPRRKQPRCVGGVPEAAEEATCTGQVVVLLHVENRCDSVGEGDRHHRSAREEFSKHRPRQLVDAVCVTQLLVPSRNTVRASLPRAGRSCAP